MITSHDPQRHLDDMVAEVLASGYARRPDVEEALRAVPRHPFIPEADAVAAHDAHRAFVTKRAEDGASLSSASAPTIVALMLDQLDVQPGHRVLEVGAGTGYNAALLDHLAGDEGQVVTVDIDPDATQRARAALDATGHPRVEMITGDGTLGAPDHGMFDRIIVTAGAWDVPPAWTDQLAPGGRLVVPLRWRGQTRSIAFTHHPDQRLLRSDSIAVCGFIPMTTADGEHRHPLDADATATIAVDRDQDINPGPLRGLLAEPGIEAWPGVTIRRREPVDGVWMRIAVTAPGAAWLITDPAQLAATGRPRLFRPASTSCVVEGDSIALFRFRTLPDTQRTDGAAAELGALGFGPACAELADRIVAAIHDWDRDRTRQPEFTLHPTGTPDSRLPAGTAIDKTHRRLVIRYPDR